MIMIVVLLALLGLFLVNCFLVAYGCRKEISLVGYGPFFRAKAGWIWLLWIAEAVWLAWGLYA